MLQLWLSAAIVTSGFLFVIRVMPYVWHVALMFVFLTLVYAVAHAQPSGKRQAELPYCSGTKESCYLSTDMNPRPRFGPNGFHCPLGWKVYRFKHGRGGYCEEIV